MGEIEFCAKNVEDLRRQLREYVDKHGKKLILKRVSVFGCGGDKSLYVFEVVG